MIVAWPAFRNRSYVAEVWRCDDKSSEQRYQVAHMGSLPVAPPPRIDAQATMRARRRLEKRNGDLRTLHQMGHVISALEDQLKVEVVEWGLAPTSRLPDHLERTLGRVAAQHALRLGHIHSTEDRGYRQCLPASAA